MRDRLGTVRGSDDLGAVLQDGPRRTSTWVVTLVFGLNAVTPPSASLLTIVPSACSRVLYTAPLASVNVVRPLAGSNLSSDPSEYTMNSVPSASVVSVSVSPEGLVRTMTDPSADSVSSQPSL